MVDSDLEIVHKFDYRGFVVCVYKVDDLISDYGYMILEDDQIVIEDYTEMYDIGACVENAISDIENELDREAPHNEKSIEQILKEVK